MDSRDVRALIISITVPLFMFAFIFPLLDDDCTWNPVYNAFADSTTTNRVIYVDAENVAALDSLNDMLKDFKNVNNTHPFAHSQIVVSYTIAARTQVHIDKSITTLDRLIETKWSPNPTIMNQTITYRDFLDNKWDQYEHEIQTQYNPYFLFMKNELVKCQERVKEMIQMSAGSVVIPTNTFELNRLKECISFMKEHIKTQHEQNKKAVQFYTNYKWDTIVIFDENGRREEPVQGRLDAAIERTIRSSEQLQSLAELDKKVTDWINGV